MTDANVIPDMNSYEEIAEFWDTHSLADYWEQTEPAEFELNPNARRRYVVNVDAELLTHIRGLARERGVNTESLTNLLLEQRLQQITVT